MACERYVVFAILFRCCVYPEEIVGRTTTDIDKGQLERNPSRFNSMKKIYYHLALVKF